ncbi:MAG: hypothetical protein Q7J58_17660 [Hydrogenophaga sp.]|uniref:hypothetical protein n=1 Tax=Hydrogenophaga sp. TaxID=1904254 RepID=UPI00271E7CC3|nr:hypothetical protein [Hydrogenophaga sp.]MDO9571180.1 hypothetical protein [Hydrogenophaga sp.]
MTLQTLLASGTAAASSAEQSVPQRAQHTLVMTGRGRVIVETRVAEGAYVATGELSVNKPLMHIAGGPLTYRVRRLAAFAPIGTAAEPDSCGVVLYAEAEEIAIPTEPLGRLGLAHQITAGAAASTSLALSAGVTRLRISVRNANCRIAIGTGSQTATNTSGASTSHFLQADTSMDVACLAGSQISVIRGTDQTVDGIVHVSELI